MSAEPETILAVVEKERKQRVSRFLMEAINNINKADMDCSTSAMYHLASAMLLIRYVIKEETRGNNECN